MLKQNLIANYIGQAWAAFMGLAFVPLYIKYLGIEAYGLIGLFAVLQAGLSLLDMGMTPTLGREMARFTGGGHSAESIRDLLRSIELFAGVLALLISLGIWTASSWLATDWLQAEKLPAGAVAQAFSIMGLVTALRFVENIYRSSISGLQRQVLLNIINIVMSTLRGLGAVGILIWVSPTIEAFFLWQGGLSIVTIAILAKTTYRLIPPGKRGGRFSLEALRSVWRFAGGMMGITILSLLLTQVDKVLLSKLLTLTEYGYYTLAAAVARTIFMFIGPIAQAWYPRFCELHASNNLTELAESYHKSTQLVTVTAGSAAIVVMFFSRELLMLWTQNQALADNAYIIVSVLMFGNLLNGFMTLPYQMQLAHGWTSLTMKINVVVVAAIIPLILWVTPIWGAVGAAWIWVAINGFYILVGVHFMYRRILVGQKWRWYTQDLILPLIPAAFVAVVFKFLVPATSTALVQGSIIVTVSAVTLTSATLTSRYLRSLLFHFLKIGFSSIRRI